MIKTTPIALSYTPTPWGAAGTRIQGLLAEPFPINVLKKRVLRKNREKTKGEAAYYIDTRDLAHRLDLILGSSGWSNSFKIHDCGDRIGVTAELVIGTIMRQGESEELKQAMRCDYDAKEKRLNTNDLVIQKAGPAALKRAAVHFGLGAYLYSFKDVITWEEIDQYGGFKNPAINFDRLPAWACPRTGPALVIHELAYYLGLPQHNNPMDYSDEERLSLQHLLEKYWGVKSLQEFADENDYFRLAGYCTNQ